MRSWRLDALEVSEPLVEQWGWVRFHSSTSMFSSHVLPRNSVRRRPRAQQIRCMDQRRMVGWAIGGRAHCNGWNGINWTLSNIWKPGLTPFHTCHFSCYNEPVLLQLLPPASSGMDITYKLPTARINSFRECIYNISLQQMFFVVSPSTSL